MKMEQTECSETSAYKIQTQGNCPEESIQLHNVLIIATTRFGTHWHRLQEVPCVSVLSDTVFRKCSVLRYSLTPSSGSAVCFGTHWHRLQEVPCVSVLIDTVFRKCRVFRYSLTPSSGSAVCCGTHWHRLQEVPCVSVLIDTVFRKCRVFQGTYS